jgi:hypothetical protein
MTTALESLETSATAVTSDRRQTDRYRVRCNSVITVFESDHNAGDNTRVEQSFQGTLVNVSDGGAQLSLDRSVPLSSLVKIECTDFLLLGEAVYCQEEAGNWQVGVHVEHGLYGLKALAEAIQNSWR